MKTVVIGAGGHARSVIDAARAAGTLELVAATDPTAGLAGATIDGIPIVGDDSMLKELRAGGVTAALNGLGGTSDNAPRARVYEMLAAYGFELPAIIHPSAVVSPAATVGPGSVVLAGGVLGPGARLGCNVIVNTGAIVEHDCQVGDHAHIATGARLGGAAVVGEGAHIGIGSCVLQGIHVGAHAIVGAGSVVLREVPAAVTVAGVPAALIQQIS